MIDGPNGVMMGVRQPSPHEAAPAKASAPAPTPAPSAQEVSAAYQAVTKNLTGKTLDARNLAAAAAQARRYAMLHEQAIAEAELEVIAQYDAQHAQAGPRQSGDAIERAAGQLSASSAFDADTLTSAQRALEAGDLHVATDKTVESFNGAVCSKTEPDPPPIVLKNEGKTPSLSEATDRLNAYLGSGMSLPEAVGILRVENGATPATEDVLARAALATQAPSFVSAYAKTPEGPDPIGLASAHLTKLGVFDADTLARATKAMTIALPNVALDGSAAQKAADKVAHDKPGTARFASDMQAYRSALTAEMELATGKHGTAWFNDPASIDGWLKGEVAVAGANLEPLARAAAGTADHSPEQKALADREHLLNLALEETRVIADIQNADAGPGASGVQIDLARSRRLTSDFSALGLVHFDGKTQQWVHDASSKANPDASAMLADLLADPSVQALKQNDIDDALRHTGGAQAESSDRAKADLRATSNALAPFKQGGTTLFYGDMLDAVQHSAAMQQRFDDIASPVKSNDNVKYVHDVAQTLQDVAMPADEDLTRALYQQKFRGRFEDFVAHGGWGAPTGLSSLWNSLDAPKYYVDTSNVYAALGDSAQAASATEQGASLMNIVKARMDGKHFVGRTYEGSLTKNGPDEQIKSFYLNWKDKHGVWSGNAQLFQDIAQAAPHSDTTRFIKAELPITVEARSSSAASAPVYVPPDATQTASGTQVITSRTQLINALGDAYQAKQLGHVGKDGARYAGSEKVYGDTTLDDLAKSALASQNAREPSVEVPLELTMLPLMYWRQDQDPNKDSPESLKLLQVDGVNGRRYVGPANTQSFDSYSDWTRASGFGAGLMLSAQHLLQTADGQSQLWDQTLTGQKKLSNGEVLLQAGEAMAGIGAMAVVSFVSPEAEGVMMPLLYDGAQLYFAATGVNAAIDAADRIAHDPTSVSAWAEGGWEVAANSFTALSIASHFGMGRLPQLLTRAFEAGQAANGEAKALSLPTRLLVSAADNQAGAKTYMALAGAPDAVLTSQRVLLKGAALTNGVLFGAQGVQMGAAWIQGQQVSPAAVMQLVATIGMGQFGRLYHVEYSTRPGAIDAIDARDAEYTPRNSRPSDAPANEPSAEPLPPYEPARTEFADRKNDRLARIDAADDERAAMLAFESGATFRARLLGARGRAPVRDVADLLLPGEKAKGQPFALMRDSAAGEFVIVPRVRGGATDRDPEQASDAPGGDIESSQAPRRVGLPKRRLSRDEEDFVAELETTAVTDDVIELNHESDPSVFVHVALEGATGALGAGPLDAATVRVMSLYRGGLPKGSGHRLLMRALERYGVRPTERLVFEYVEHSETVQAKADGVPAEDTPLARTGMRALRALGLTPSSAHYADNRWNHWDIVIELDPRAAVVGASGAVEHPLVWSRAWNGDICASVAGLPTSRIVVSPWASVGGDGAAPVMILSGEWTLTPSRGGAVLANFIDATGQRDASQLTLGGAGRARETAEAVGRGVQVRDTVLGRMLEEACLRLQRTPVAWRFTPGMTGRVTVELAPAHRSQPTSESRQTAAMPSLSSLAGHMPDLIVSSPAGGSPLVAFGRAPSTHGDFVLAAAVRDGRIVDAFGEPLPIEALAHQMLSVDRFANKTRVILLTDGPAPDAAPALARVLRHLQVPVLARDHRVSAGEDDAWRLHLGDQAAMAHPDAADRPVVDVILGYGNSKVAYAVRMPGGARKVVTVLRDSRSSDTLDQEHGVLQALKDESIPVLDVERGRYIGRPALYADRYATSLKALLKAAEDQPRDPLTERATLTLLRAAGVPIAPETSDAITRVGESMTAGNVRIADFDMFVGRIGDDGRADGSAVVADPLRWDRGAPLARDLEDVRWLSHVIRSGSQARNEAAPQAMSGRPLREVALSDDGRTMALTDTDGHSVTAVLLGGRAAPPEHPDDILVPNGEKRGQRFELVCDPQDGTLVLLPRVRGGAVDEDPEAPGEPAPVNAMRALQDGTITPERYAQLLTDMRAALHHRGGLSPARSESVDALRVRIERLLEDEARTPVPRENTGKRRTVEGEGAEHDARVRAIVNTALLAARASVTNGELLRTPLIQTHAQALDLVIGIRTLSVRNSESLALRDADHYLSNLVQEWQVPFDRQTAGQYRTPSAPLARLSGLVSRVYDLTKARQTRTEPSADGRPDADISNREPRDIAPSPPGGRAWAALGTRHFLGMRKTAGSPDHHWVLTETPGGRHGHAATIGTDENRANDRDAGGPSEESAAATRRTVSASTLPSSGPGGIQRLTRPKAKPGEQDRLLYSGLPVEEDPAAMLYVPRVAAGNATDAGNASRSRAKDAENRRATREPIPQSPERRGPFQTGYPAKKSEYPLPQWMASYVPETGLIRTEARKGDVQWVPRRYTERRDATKVVTIAPGIHVISAFGTREAVFDLDGRPVTTIADLRRRALTPQRLANRLSENFGLDERAYTPGQPIALMAEHTAAGGRTSFAQQLANEVHAPVYGLVGSYEDREWMLHFPDAASHPVWQPDMTGRRWSPDGGQPVRVKWNLLEHRDSSDLEVHSNDNPVKIDSYLAPQGMFVVNGHTSELLARGPAEVAAGARAAGHASDKPVLVLTTDADAQRHAFARQLADELGSPVMLLTDDAWALDGAAVVKNTVTVSRVEGAQNRRMTIDDEGRVAFVDTQENRGATVWLNFGPLERTQAYFEQKHGTMDDVVVHSFEVPRSALDEIRRNAVRQSAAQAPGNEDKPVLGDWLASPDQFGVRWPDAVRLQDQAIRGTGRTTVFEPRPRGPDGATSRRRAKHRADGTQVTVATDAASERAEAGAPMIHPRKGESGEDVVIASRTLPSDRNSWTDPAATAVFVPDGEHPTELNGIALTQWEAPTTLEGWQNVAGQNPNLDVRIGDQRVKKAGTVVVEPDGRVWIIESTNHFTGARSFPKGTVDDGLSLQATAIKETYEETGLHVEIVGHLTDFRQNTGKPKTRYYLARRTGGTPTAMGWETQGVYLVPANELGNTLKTARDMHVLRALLRSGAV